MPSRPDARSAGTSCSSRTGGPRSAQALARARPGDIVLLAGKGHEATILYADRAEPWNEHAEALAALAELGWAATP